MAEKTKCDESFQRIIILFSVSPKESVNPADYPPILFFVHCTNFKVT